jgi:glycosyltransferase involved in cell wall biosynthesis
MITYDHVWYPVNGYNDEHISGYLPMSFSFDPRRLFGWFLDKFVYPEITLSALPISAATAISEVTKRNLLKVGIRSSRFSVIYQGIPAQDFPGKPTPGTCNVPLRLLFVGQILRYKGVHTVVAAAHRLATTGLGVSLTIAGAGDDAYESELRVLAAGGPASVTFAGHVPRGHISQLYRDHDVFVFASTWEEPFGLTHLEAMASGLPVVSTLCGGQREFLRPEVNCLAYEPEDDEMLARQIRRLSDSPDLSERIARTGQEVTINQFSVERYTDELLALLEVSRR